MWISRSCWFLGLVSLVLISVPKLFSHLMTTPWRTRSQDSAQRPAKIAQRYGDGSQTSALSHPTPPTITLVSQPLLVRPVACVTQRCRTTWVVDRTLEAATALSHEPFKVEGRVTLVNMLSVMLVLFQLPQASAEYGGASGYMHGGGPGHTYGDGSPPPSWALTPPSPSTSSGPPPSQPPPLSLLSLPPTPSVRPAQSGGDISSAGHGRAVASGCDVPCARRTCFAFLNLLTCGELSSLECDCSECCTLAFVGPRLLSEVYPPSLPSVPPGPPVLPDPPSVPPVPPAPPAPPSIPTVCPCVESFPPTVNVSESGLLVNIAGDIHSYPPAYGLNSCDVFDVGLRPFCHNTVNNQFSPLDNPRWCSQSWCFVNESSCNVAWTRSSYVSGMVYSYET